MNTRITHRCFIGLLALTLVTMPVLAAGPNNVAVNNTVSVNTVGKVSATGTATPDAGMGWSVSKVEYTYGTGQGNNFVPIDTKLGTLNGGNYICSWTGVATGQYTVRMTATFSKPGQPDDVKTPTDCVITVR